jgi:hypothetical protein
MRISIDIFFCAFCVGFELFVFPEPELNAIGFSKPGMVA